MPNTGSHLTYLLISKKKLLKTFSLGMQVKHFQLINLRNTSTVCITCYVPTVKFIDDLFLLSYYAPKNFKFHV